jgi:hypothetical protein
MSTLNYNLRPIGHPLSLSFQQSFRPNVEVRITSEVIARTADEGDDGGVGPNQRIANRRTKERQDMTETDTATPIRKVVDGYFAMWNETDPMRRREVTATTWSQDASYIDPMFTAEGHDSLDAMVAAVHQQFPGHRFRLTGPIDIHHDRARWGWELAGPDGSPPVAVGVDFAVLAPDGRLREVTGFFEQPAVAA